MILISRAGAGPELSVCVRSVPAEVADAAKAHERLAAGHVLGKIVLRIR